MNDEKNSSRQIPPLYHYTSQDGLRGIIESKSLWFTNIFYLNDASEFNYIYNLVKDELNLKTQNALRGLIVPNEHLIVEFLKNALKVGKLTELLAYYVSSFSEVEDQLSQWRGYCGNGDGYCVEFDADKILSFVNKKKASFDIKKCIYEEQQQRKIIREIIEESYKVLNQNDGVEIIKKISGTDSPLTGLVKPLTNEESEKISPVLTDFFSGLFLNAPVFKHPTFYEEREWRIFSIFGRQKGVRTKFRSGKSMLIPYKEIQIAESNEKMPIKRIIVGPTNHPELSRSAVEDLLLTHSIECEVELSEIPYRD